MNELLILYFFIAFVGYEAARYFLTLHGFIHPSKATVAAVTAAMVTGRMQLSTKGLHMLIKGLLANQEKAEELKKILSREIHKTIE